MVEKYDEEALGGAARKWHKRIAFKKGIGIGLVAGAISLTTLFTGVTHSYKSQEEMVSAYESEYHSDIYTMAETRDSALYQQLEDSEALQSGAWKEYVAEHNTVTGVWKQASRKQEKEFYGSILFPDLKSRMSRIVDFEDRMEKKNYGFGFNDPLYEKALFRDINMACKAEISISENGVPIFTDSEKVTQELRSASVLAGDGTPLSETEITEKEAVLMKEGLLPAVEAGKEIFCPKP